MTHHRLSLYAGLALLQLPLLGCPQGSFSETSDSTGTTTPVEDDTTFGHIQTVTGDVPTTGVTTGENTTADDTTEGVSPEEPSLEKTCNDCGDPDSVQVCLCIDASATAHRQYACPGDTGFSAAAEQACKSQLNKPELSPGDFHCMEQIMCPADGTIDPLIGTCASCGGPNVDHFYCISDSDLLVFETYACADALDAESDLKAQCAVLLGKVAIELTLDNFFRTVAECPETGTTGDDTTGDGTTDSGTTAGEDTAGTTIGDTTGADTTGINTSGDTTAGEDSTGGVAPLTGCPGWDPSAAIDLAGGVHYVDIKLVTELLADPTPLLECDDVRLAPLAVGGYEVRNADPGELLFELGLRDGDVPLLLSGHSLASVGDVISAVNQLWFIEEASNYTLILQRGSTSYTLQYSLTD